jgi:hypothetical protein
LFEVLIVVAIIALVSAGVGVSVMKPWIGAQTKTTESNARAIRGAVKAWWIEHEVERCPSVEDLLATGTLDRDSPRQDAWGEAWHIECRDHEVTVSSSGRDRRLGTPDDIRVPPA